MENEIREPSAEETEMLELGVTLGHGHAFGLVAGRCSAAQAQSLRRLREEKKYLKVSLVWKDFCPQYLGMSSSQADRIIARLDEFGPGYFELAQLTRISADTYRVVAPVVNDRALHFNNEIITLDPENARKVAEVVTRLRREAVTKAERSDKCMKDLLADIDQRFQQIVKDIEGLMAHGGDNWKELVESVDRMSIALRRLAKEHKM